MHREMKVSVLIATRDRPDALRRCLASVAQQRYPDLEVLVLDDASSTPLDDASVCRGATGLSVRCLRSDERLGPIGSRNVLMQQARGDVFVVLDDDACLGSEEDIHQAAAALQQYPDVGILAFKLIERTSDGERLLVPYARRRLRKQPHLAEQAAPVAYYLAGSHAVRRAVIEQCGYFQEGLCYGHEELDLSYRALDAGFKILYLPAVTAYHLPDTPTARWNAWKLYHSVRNRLFVAYKYLPLRYLPVHTCFWLCRYGWRALADNMPGAFGRGVRDGLAGLRNQDRHPLRPEAVAYLKAHGGRLWW